MSGVAEVSSTYLAKMASNSFPVGYKQTEVGVIPEDWEIFSLSSLSAKITDGTHDTPRPVREGRPFLTAIHVKDGHIDFDGCYFVSETVHQEIYRRCNPEFGDILMVNIGAGTATTAVVNVTYEFSLKNVALIKPNKFNNGTYVNYALSFAREKTLETVVGGGAQPFLSLNQIANLKIAAPHLKEQTAIANALSDVDALISELEKLIAKKQAIKTATMQQLLTGRTRLPQFALREDGTPKGTKPSELGEIPVDWKILAMGDLGSTYGGLSGKSKQDFGHGNSLYVPFTNVMANVVVDVDNLEKVDVRETQNNLALGDLLFNGSSETPEEVCFSALVSADIRKLYLNSFCFGFRSNQKNAYLPLYLAYWFRSEVGRAAVLVMAQGSTRYNISKSQFMKLPIVLPDTEEQTAIATILSDMDAEIQALNQRLSKTRQIKQGMMQELLTGKTRLVQPVNKESQHD
ncbi:restriction endonuclease subunit S [Proteus mirabilis]|uniref:restriction endonuclease subunit S n=1 Tax=Proteus mirabilis TaxID=584 RepID=UPI00235F9FA4|nr:restriction endonuclease subunit S [Proteus mirabilis]MDC9735341.1 restriction endonuclease subunit S [Proteus mirabilis]MDC9774386.1 restriction endonuclease subunit S [Proteus mirabilis]MDC9782051.1 restriction endonuclease subunit S [Proteus mirabilis]